MSKIKTGQENKYPISVLERFIDSFDYNLRYKDKVEFVYFDVIDNLDRLKICEVYFKYKDENYNSTMGYVLLKDDVIHIYSNTPGDDRGATVWNNIFIVSGHDGSILYDIDDPKNICNNTW